MEMVKGGRAEKLEKSCHYVCSLANKVVVEHKYGGCKKKEIAVERRMRE